jgi:glucose/mannose-6-phosphate isomerase
MYKTYDLWPELAKKAFESNLKTLSLHNIKHIVLAGMGGSGAICEVLSSILSETNIHTNVVKGYHLPNTVNEKTLVVVVSVSGNTSETLSILESAFKKSCHIVSFSSGGKMEKICNEKKILHYLISMHHSPRSSFPSFLYSMLNVMYDILPISKSDIYQSIDELENLKKNICSNNLINSNISLSLAKQIVGIPILYYPWGLKSAAIRFKNSLNENTKIHAISVDIVEAAHNEIVAWEKKSNVIPIIIRGPNDYEKTQVLQTTLEKYFKEYEINFLTINSISGSILTKLTYLIYLCDYASIYAAVLSKSDPTPVNSINYFKKHCLEK